jgi:exopolysaccharide biosynthesis polyprenyl glycosylphosphotransferase
MTIQLPNTEANPLARLKPKIGPRGKDEAPTPPAWSTFRRSNAPKAQHVAQPDLDAKAAQMLEIYATRRFSSARAAQRLRLRLILWVLRTKLTQHAKRVFDCIVAGATLILVAPLIALIALAIRLDSPGPIIFKQERIGRWGIPFGCYKFRSMTVDAEDRKAELLALNEADGVVFKMRNDPRVTRVGRIIRKASLDELPQLVNVLKGEMSLVGPRPQIPHEVEQYRFEEYRRLTAVPGITGLQQVSGRSDLDFKRWIELDLRYVAEQSLLKDIEILLRTVPAVLFGRGAY